MKGVSAVAERLLNPGGAACRGYRFHFKSTGPWGEDIRGGWMTFDDARAVYLAERRAHFSRAGRPMHSFWFDWHATR